MITIIFIGENITSDLNCIGIHFYVEPAQGVLTISHQPKEIFISKLIIKVNLDSTVVVQYM